VGIRAHPIAGRKAFPLGLLVGNGRSDVRRLARKFLGLWGVATDSDIGGIHVFHSRLRTHVRKRMMLADRDVAHNGTLK
jgi:hypothetical protein